MVCRVVEEGFIPAKGNKENNKMKPSETARHIIDWRNDEVSWLNLYYS